MPGSIEDIDPVKGDVVNDLNGASEPSFVSVAICTGVDMDGEPVTLLDRLCINRPGVELVAADMSICQQEAKAFRSEVDHLHSQLKTANSAVTSYLALSGFLLVLLVMTCGFLLIGRRK